ncbi:MAG: transglutaminase domain-containing protein [Chloroflexi bacterium]|nr:transglutaminase domain-containing protein [Chloroflexota bacterium]
MANWSEYIQSRPVTTIQDRKPRTPPKLPAWLTDWETWLTFGLVLVVFLSVARSVDTAAWVRRMPSLVAVSFIALCTGLILSRIRAPEVILHLLALFTGAAVVLWLTLQFIDAPTLREGLSEFKARWGAWIEVVRNNDPTSDNMPFVMLVLSFTWITAYLASWSIFRWRNAWLALVPAGIGLLTNISYQPGQRSYDFVVFMFGAMLLVMRVHMLNKVRDWNRRGMDYPQFLSLRLLNITTWVAIGALVLAWQLPQANEVGPVARAWERVAGPFSGDSDQFVRLFSSIDAKKEVPLHSFGDTLPLQGRVVLSSKIAAQVDFGEGTNLGRPLRAAVYETYTPAGWKNGSRTETDLGPTEQVTPSGNPKAAYKDRQEIQANFVMESGFPKNSLPTIGQPSQVSVNSRAEIISTDPVPDVNAVRSRQKFKIGDAFVTTGSISTASEQSLRGAGVQYPQYITDRYLQLPDTLPGRVRQLSASLVEGRPTAFDKAKAIEEYLRTFPPTFDIKAAPPGRDAVDYFLFDEKKGYFDYQASAMVVLLRAAGVPARLAVGYLVDEYDISVRRYLLRDKHAFAWPEVYFPGYGWVEFSPYGDAPVISRPAGDTTPGDVPLSPDDMLRDGPGLDFGDIDQGAMPDVTPVAAAKSNPFKPLLPVLYVLMGILVVGAVAGTGVRLAWERGMGGLDYPSQLWEKTVRLASWLRLGPKPHQTPIEFSRALQKSLPASTEGVETVARGYQRSRYGRQEVTQEQADELDTAWRPLRNGLVKRLLRWK